jgi:hypothetical protein
MQTLTPRISTQIVGSGDGDAVVGVDDGVGVGTGAVDEGLGAGDGSGVGGIEVLGDGLGTGPGSRLTTATAPGAVGRERGVCPDRRTALCLACPAPDCRPVGRCW